MKKLVLKIVGVLVLIGVLTVMVNKSIQEKNDLKTVIQDWELKDKMYKTQQNQIDGLKSELERLKTLTDVQEEELKLYRKKPYSKDKLKLKEKSNQRNRE